MIRRWLARFLAVVLPVFVLGGAVWVATMLLATAPETERVTEERLAPVVRVVEVESKEIQRVVEAYGTVLPAQEVELSSEIEGRVLEIHPSLQPGGIIQSGELLLKIDPEQYELAVERAQAALSESEAALEVEAGRQRVAEREWELFGKDLPDSELGRDLMLREPQMNQARARIDSARSDVEQAKLDLKRTSIYAPFDAMVLIEQVDLGQRVSPGASIATLIGTDEFWVRASVPIMHLATLLHAAEDESNTVNVFADVDSLDAPAAEGRLIRHLGQVDPEGRMAQILVSVQDPLALAAENAARIPLPINSYVRVDLNAGSLNGAVAVPWKAMRENNELWVADSDGFLRVRNADVLWRQEEFVAVSNVFQPGDRLIISPMDQALPGMEVRARLEGEGAPAEEQGRDPALATTVMNEEAR